MSWKILFKDGTSTFWPASCWTAQELVKMMSISKFELVKDKLIKKKAA